jgi:hypothetical protein
MRWGLAVGGGLLLAVLFATNPAPDQFAAYLSPRLLQAAQRAIAGDPIRDLARFIPYVGGAVAEIDRQQDEAAFFAGLHQYLADHLTRTDLFFFSIYAVCIPAATAGQPGSLRPWLGIAGQFVKLGHREC